MRIGKKRLSLMLACIAPLLSSFPAAADSSAATPDYLLASRFGFTLSIYAYQGRYEVEQLTTHAAGATVPPSPWQSWFGSKHSSIPVLACESVAA